MREKFGRFVLLSEVEATGLGTEYRAAKLGPSGLDRLVSLVRFAPALSATPEIAKDVLEHVKQAAQLQNPYILKVNAIGKIESSHYISYEFSEGRTLRAILSRCRQEGFPFSVNHTLLIVSKVCSALDFAYARQGEDGRPFFHGLLTPSALLLSNDGEVRVRFFGVGRSRIWETNALGEDDMAYLAPEQHDGGLGGAAADAYALGAILFECLTGERFEQAGRDQDVVARIAAARLQDPSVEPRTIPEAVSEILRRSLAESPHLRYPRIEDMRKAIDTLLFSGDFTPTTFNLAFLMHSLFREEVERETQLIKQEREGSYAEFLTDEPTLIIPPPASVPAQVPLPRRLEPLPESPSPLPADRTEPYQVEALRVKRAAPRSPSLPRILRSVPLPLAAIGVAVLLLGGLGAFLVARRSATAPVPAPITPQMQAALARVQELEAKLKTLEDEKSAAEFKAAADAKAQLEAQARRRGQPVDPQQVQRAQAEAARRARDEQNQRAAELARQIRQSQNDARTVLEREGAIVLPATPARSLALATPAPATAAPATPAPATPALTLPVPGPPSLTTPVPVPPQSAAAGSSSPVAASPAGGTPGAATPAPPETPAQTPGSVPPRIGAPLIPPTLQSAPRINYPPLALQRRIEGTVEIRAFVNEQGVVSETQLVRGVAAKSGLNEAAIESVRLRRYRPATQNGVPVGTWITIRVQFQLPR